MIAGAEDFFEAATIQVGVSAVGAVGWHDHVDRLGPRRPDFEVFPFQNRVERAADVEGQEVRFGAEEDHRHVRLPANVLGELLIGPAVLLDRRYECQVDEPATHRKEENCHKAGHEGTRA